MCSGEELQTGANLGSISVIQAGVNFTKILRCLGHSSLKVKCLNAQGCTTILFWRLKIKKNEPARVLFCGDSEIYTFGVGILEGLLKSGGWWWCGGSPEPGASVILGTHLCSLSPLIVKNCCFWVRQLETIKQPSSTLWLTCCVILSKLLSHSVPSFCILAYWGQWDLWPLVDSEN